MAEEAKAANVVEALARVMRDLPGIGKDSNAAAAQGGYSYRGIEAITRAVSPLLAKHGVVFAPQVHEWQQPRELMVNNKPWTDERLAVTYRVYGPGGRDDYIEVGPIPAIGRDNSDKGTNKCMTQAFKYALTQALCIGDGKDDGDNSTHEADAPSRTRRQKPPSGVDGNTGEVAAKEAWEGQHAEYKRLSDAVAAMKDKERAATIVEWVVASKIGPDAFTVEQRDEIEAMIADKPAGQYAAGEEPF